jgi:putative ABC transport system permease protein
MINDYVSLALKNLKHRGIRSWLTILGIFIGITAVVALIMLGNGLKMTINSQFGISNTEVITVQAGGINSFGPPGSGAVEPLTNNEVEEIKKIKGVEVVVGGNIVSSTIEYNDKQIFGYLNGIPNENNEREFFYKNIDAKIMEGKKLERDDLGKILLGYNFGVDKVGFEKEIKPRDKIFIEGNKFEVAGILEKKGSFIFDNVVYMNEKDLEKIGNYGEEVDFIDVKVENKEFIEDVKKDIERVLRKERGVKEGKENFEVSTPEASLETVNQILLGVQIFILLIAGISILVGGIGIINTMTTSVMERKKEIGIMKATGAKNSQIFILFFIESGLMGLVGGIIGILFGVIIGYLGIIGINNFVGSSVKPQIDYILILLVLIGSFLIGSVSGILPALQAANQNPVEALRG